MKSPRYLMPDGMPRRSKDTPQPAVARSDAPPWHGPARPLARGAFDIAAARLGCEVAAIKAVWEVEAAGRHFMPDGSLVRRFEPHHMPRATWARLGFDPGGAIPWRASLKIAPDAREAMLLRAFGLDPEAALRATSWGAPQIMGFNHRDAGFSDAGAMVQAMAQDADAQLSAFCALISAWGLGAAVRGHDWQAFARRYNGSGKVGDYARRIEAAYRRHAQGARSPEVLRVGDRGAAVRRLQEGLSIEVDGAFGPRTLDAVERFQAEAELPVDGVVGARTWAALETARGAQPPLQAVAADHIAERAGQISGAAAAITAVAAAVGEFRMVLPEGVFTFAAYGAASCALIFALASGLRWVRAR